MKEEFRPAITALLTELEVLEHKVAETKTMVNRLHELAGEPPMFAEVSASDRKGITTLRSDQFYGRVLTTAAREYLEMRNAANLGPATPREIYHALLEGGFKFETRNEDNAITNIRATLRKNSSIFHRLPNNEYGLLAWYPNAKVARQDEDEHSQVGPTSHGPRHRASTARKRTRPHKKAKIPYANIAIGLMADGEHWTTDRLKEQAIARNIPGIDETTKRRVFHGALLGLKKRGLVTMSEKGWQLVTTGQDRPSGGAPKLLELKGAA